MTWKRTNRLLASAVVAMALAAVPADAQRRAGGARSAQVSNRAGMGQAGQHHQVRSEARTNVDRNSNRNVNRNVNRDLNVDVDVHHEYGYGYDWDDHYHPVARAAVVATAAAVTTAAIVGSYYRSLPPSCVTVYRGSVTYYQCGSSWYQPVYSGTTIQYVVVNAP